MQDTFSNFVIIYYSQKQNNIALLNFEPLISFKISTNSIDISRMCYLEMKTFVSFK